MAGKKIFVIVLLFLFGSLSLLQAQEKESPLNEQNLSIVDIETDWYSFAGSSGSYFKVGGKYYPRIKFRVRNYSKNTIDDFHLEVVYFESSATIFGRALQRVGLLGPYQTSNEFTVHPLNSVVCSRQNKKYMGNNKYRVEFYIEYLGERRLIKTARFSSSKVNAH